MQALNYIQKASLTAMLLLMAWMSSGFAPAGEANMGGMRWSHRRKLTWDDFKGPVNPNSNMRAETYSRINYTYVCRMGQMEAQVTAEFVPERSWVKSDPSENLLKHEQGHFDITEVYARKLRKHFESMDFLCGKGQAAVDAEAKKLFQEWNAAQDLYDTETNHSKNIASQRDWENRIQDELKSLELWATE